MPSCDFLGSAQLRATIHTVEVRTCPLCKKNPAPLAASPGRPPSCLPPLWVCPPRGLQVNAVMSSALFPDGRLAPSITSSGFFRDVPRGSTSLLFPPVVKGGGSVFSQVRAGAQRGKTLAGGHTADNRPCASNALEARFLPPSLWIWGDSFSGSMVINSGSRRPWQAHSPGLNPTAAASVSRRGSVRRETVANRDCFLHMAGWSHGSPCPSLGTL